MEEKKAFVFDTNFIIQNKKLDEVYDSLKEKYNVYVTQVSIDERSAQQCREARKKYEEIPKLQEKYQNIAEIKEKESFGTHLKRLNLTVQNSYKRLFNKNIIPLKKSEARLNEIIDRANNKIPPFIESTSDKGFKDTLMWLSILDFFKTSSENEIIFVTDDNGFRENVESLKNEFENNTGRKIIIQSNSYYKELIKDEQVEEILVVEKKIPDVSELRDKIDNIISDICYFWERDYYNNNIKHKYFSLSKKVDSLYIEQIFTNLSSRILENLFEKFISSEIVFNVDDRLSNGEYKIPIENLEKANTLYKDIKNLYPEYMNQFYSTVATIFNENYSVPIVISDTDLPF